MRRKYILRIIVAVSLLIAIGVNIYGRREVHRKNVVTEGYFFNTREIAPEVKGFGGHIEMLVELNKDGSIKDIEVLQHAETREYAAGITQPEFLSQFKGKVTGDSFEDIDAITRATISSKAVARTLKTSLERLKGRSVEKQISLDLNLDFYITVLIITFLLLVFYLKKARLRYAGLLVSIAYFGFLKANFISMTTLMKIFLWQIPEIGPNIAWFVFIFAGLALTFLLGAFYCSYMCPFGGLQMFLSKIFKVRIEISVSLTQRLRKIRYILLWILSVLALTLNNPNIVNYEPFSAVFLRRGSMAAWSIVFIILILSLFHHRPFCNYFCAVGAFMDILSGIGRRIFKRR